MMKALLWVAVIFGLGCKGPKPASRSELDSALRGVLQVGIPSGATDVSGRIMTAMTHMVDVEFTCEPSAFHQFWDSSPRLSAAMAGSDVDLEGSSAGPDFESEWSSSGGTQFCTVSASTTDEGSVRVVIRSTHEHGNNKSP